MNEVAYSSAPGVVTVAEESTAWPGVSHPTYTGGLGFGFKWNMGWMHDTLRYIGQGPDPPPPPPPRPHLRPALRLHRELHPAAQPRRGRARQGLAPRQDAGRPLAALRQPARLFRLHVGASRQEAPVHGRRVRPGARVEPRPQPRLAPARRPHASRRSAISCATSTAPIAASPALHERDCEAGGFEWIVSDDDDNSVIAWLRRGDDDGRPVVVVANFTPVPRHGYRLGVPLPGFYKEIVNTDAAGYGGAQCRQSRRPMGGGRREPRPAVLDHPDGAAARDRLPRTAGVSVDPSPSGEGRVGESRPGWVTRVQDGVSRHGPTRLGRCRVRVRPP